MRLKVVTPLVKDCVIGALLPTVSVALPVGVPADAVTVATTCAAVPYTVAGAVKAIWEMGLAVTLIVVEMDAVV